MFLHNLNPLQYLKTLVLLADNGLILTFNSQKGKICTNVKRTIK